jgi:hypothetical protein
LQQAGMVLEMLLVGHAAIGGDCVAIAQNIAP